VNPGHAQPARPGREIRAAHPGLELTTGELIVLAPAGGAAIA
jgi:hypothetical protein